MINQVEPNISSEDIESVSQYMQSGSWITEHKLTKELLPQLKTHEDEWLGFRPTLPDFLPIIGPSKNYKNVFYSFGHHHLGWTLGAISGKIISKMIAEEKTNLDLQPYSSIRFS